MAAYKCQDYTAVVDGRPYRLIVVHSSKFDKRKASKLEWELGRKKAQLEEKIPELGAVEFACEPDAAAALEKLKQECSGLFYGVYSNIGIDEVMLKWTRRGRPVKGEEAPTKTVWHAKTLVGR